MKIFKYLTIVFLLLPPFRTVGLAQVGVIVNAAKAGVKKEAKQAAKAGVKQVVKAEIKQAAKAETKQFIKSETKQAVKAEMKNAIKAEAKQAAKTEVKNAIKAETKTALKTESRQIAKKEASLTTKRTLNSDLGKKSFSSFNKNTGKNVVYSKADHINLISQYSSSVGLDAKQQEKLLIEMTDDIGLAELIHNNPQFNIKRWAIARKSVDKTKLAKVNGRTVVNGNQYAGKSFFFNPHLNRDIKAKLDAGKTYNNSTYEQLIALDKKYPNGIPFNEKGFPDFIKADACYKINGKVLKVTLPNFTGDRAKDNILANNYLISKGINIKTEGYTWHHMEGAPPTMVLVDSDVHSVVKHSGGHSMAR